ncbi:MAG: aminoacyl-tRNA hydrolase, partial [Clostridia bacterium]|nr:aminoacyl-tRNA hydrolase [Clostridia bacterium]
MYIIIGLGNPGREYAKTRHNVGYMTADTLAEKLGVSVTRKGFRSVYGEGRIGAEKVVIAKPETFMNNSGYAAVDLMNWYKPEHDRLIVIYDDIDLPCGALRIRSNGSAGTHNGMRSVTEQLGF